MRKQAMRSLSLAGWLMAGAAVALVGCSDDAGTGSNPADGEPQFSSMAPGSGGKASGDFGSEAGGGSGAPTGGNDGGGGAPTVEDGDVARLFGDTLYILNPWRGLQIVDVKDGKAPKLVQRVPMQGQPQEMYVDGKEAIVALSRVASFESGAGAPAPSAGSQLRRVALGTSPAVTATAQVPGVIAATRKIGDKLVVVAPQVLWNPWWFGCYGPYGCVATATDGGAEAGGGAVGSGSAGGSGTSAGGATTDVGVAYPGGYGGGWSADATKVLVYDLATAGALKLVGEVELAGGVQDVAIEAGEVVIASQQWSWDDKTQSSSVTERLVQVTLGADGKPTLGAKLEATAKADGNVAGLVKMHRVGAGHVALLRQKWSNGTTQIVTSYKAAAGSWSKGGERSFAGSYTGVRAGFSGSQAMLLYGEASSGGDGFVPGKDDEEGGTDSDGGSGSTPGAGGAPDPAGGNGASLQIVALDLADAATVVEIGVAKLESGLDAWATTLAPLAGGRWLLAYRLVDGETAALRTAKAEAGALMLAAELKVPDAYGWGASALGDALLLLPTYAAGGDGKVVHRLVSVATDGALALRGSFASAFDDWSSLGNLLATERLYRLAHAGLEIVDVKDLDKPAPLGSLDLAVAVQDLLVVGERVVTLVQSWADGKAYLRVLPKGSADDLATGAQVAIGQAWGQLRSHGSFVYVITSEGVRVVDLQNADAPKLRGQITWPQTGQVNVAGHSRYWHTWNLPQQGSTLYLVGTDLTLTQKTGSDCSGGEGGESVPPTSGGEAPDKAGADSGGGSSGSSGSSGGGSSGSSGSDGGSTGVATCWGDPAYKTLVAAIDLSDADAPKLGTVLELPQVSWVSEAQVSGKLLVMTHYESKKAADGSWTGSYWLDRVDISAPATPKFVDKVNIPGWLVGLSADGNDVVTLDWQLQAGTKAADGKVESVLHALTISKGKAKLVKSLTMPSSVGAALRDGDTVYVGTMPYWWAWPADAAAGAKDPSKMPKSEIFVFDVSKPTAMAQTATLDAGTAVGNLQVAGGQLFAAAGSGLGVARWSLADPNKPVYAGFAATNGGYGSRVAVQGNVAWLPAGWFGVEKLPLD
ncbi:MAG: hypothetical protein H6747_15565 [Deltaproteobacteria bacterium]|nr:hypothetical protein [Deltaproteobacteria bacterium]